MTQTPLACIILAAGKGTRMNSTLPKVLHQVAGRSIVHHVLAAAGALQPERVIVVVGPEMAAVSAAVAPVPTVIQAQQRGTADAVLAARAALAGFTGTVLVLVGDTPLITPATLRALVAAREGAGDPAVAVLGMHVTGPNAYGRLVRDGDGGLDRIVEFLDATPEQRQITLCNSGLLAFCGRRLFGLLDQIKPDNAKGEYYLTDAVAVARAAGARCVVVEGAAEDVAGVNSRAELAAVEASLQRRLRASAMAGGATLIDPDTVYLSADTVLGRDIVVGPHVVFGPGVSVGDAVEIKPFCHFEGVQIESGAVIGPFARLRPGSTVGAGAHVGNFVEIKNSQVAAGAKINHLSYIGDATIGARVNVGAGTITCNYDGFGKYRTEIGAGAFIGSNTALVAPVTVGAGAIIGAGSVITQDVAPDALAIARGRQADFPARAPAIRALRQAAKAAKAKLDAI
ncbi:MAG: bifunctional UDP-N-acetylglucosamine diphosphorylase/glucosamine-1-phosphate N-acetyltransferase GlmU [Azospirillaceae bacterium]|nr:bifunctional UDP-N-acetylglucosamine diphosphorylase/glucosamine-1-phosphate N-acetyltransferase GlmU [Azospirillaceae bacterium]